MIEASNHTADTLLGALIAAFAGALTWLARLFFRHVSPESGLHQTPKEREALADVVKKDLESHREVVRQALEAHDQLDRERFDTINDKLDNMREDYKHLLKRPSGARKKT